MKISTGILGGGYITPPSFTAVRVRMIEAWFDQDWLNEVWHGSQGEDGSVGKRSGVMRQSRTGS